MAMRALFLTSLLLVIQAGLAAAAAPPPLTEEELPPPPPVQQQPAPEQPAPAMPPPAATPAQGPLYFNGPVYIIPAPVTGQPVAPPPVMAPAPPVVTAVPPVAAPRVAARPRPRPDDLRHRFGIGVRPGGMWLAHRLYNTNLLMGGAGPLVRLRASSLLGLELGFDVLHMNIHEGVFQRTSYPLQLSALFYLTPPRSGPHFNVYGAIGGGIMPSKIRMDDRLRPQQEMSATELLGNLGVGFEMRVWRLSLGADARALGLLRTGDPDYYNSFIHEDAGPKSLGLTQPAVQPRTYGCQFNFTALLWL
jgi:hypothetical protein